MMHSVSVGGKAFATACTLEIKPPCVSIAPFASTVVPMVKIIDATVSGVTSTFGKSAGISGLEGSLTSLSAPTILQFLLILCRAGFVVDRVVPNFSNTFSEAKIDFASVNSAIAKISWVGVCASSGTTTVPIWIAAR